MSLKTASVLAASVLALVTRTTVVRANAPTGQLSVTSGVVTDTQTGLAWQQVASQADYTLAQATSYCAAFSLQGGGWRVPTLNELATIFDERYSFDPTAFPSEAAYEYWTSSPYLNETSNEWLVNFAYGSTYGGDVTQAANRRVRCVR
jgi:hypothetical protein